MIEPMEHTKKVIEATTLLGESRKYTLNLMDAETGLKIFHNYASVIVNFLPDLLKLLPALKSITGKSEDDNRIVITPELMEIVQLIPLVFTWDRIAELAREMLGDSTVEIDGNIENIGVSGIGKYTTGNPLELYTAIFQGIMVNYAPLLASLTSDEEDSPQDAGKK